MVFGQRVFGEGCLRRVFVRRDVYRSHTGTMDHAGVEHVLCVEEI
jgi:hypothetical protein